MASGGVVVAVEAVIENKIQEVRLDGQEFYETPLSMSESLTKNAHKIDFGKDERAETGKPTSEGEKETEEEKVLAPFQPSLWPWDSVRNKLKASLIEMSVLLDVLNVSKEKRYMVLDPISSDVSDSRSSDSKQSVQLLAKKRSLLAAANLLINGADRLKVIQLELGSRAQNDFHTELSKLRQNWRLKKVGESILGDLSYKSVGSRFYQGGTFEVLKTTMESGERGDSLNPKYALEVKIPSELEGVAYIQVEVKTVSDSIDITSATLKMPQGLGGLPSDAYWQRKLEVAQNVLFCKELFAQLARESVQVKLDTPHLVVGNQIITNVFPSVQLSIILCHYTGKEKRVPVKLEHNHVLEHSLHQLLREFHYKTLHYPAPHPVTATFGMSKRRRLAGPEGLDKRDLLELTESETLLEQIIKQTKHTILRLRVMQCIDKLSSDIQDPQITAHWSCLNSAVESSVKIYITTSGYESVRTFTVLQIGIDTIKAILKDGRTCNMSFEVKEVEDFILWLISQHQISATQILTKIRGWVQLSCSGSVGVGEKEELSTASSIMIASPNHDKILSIRSGPTSGIHIYLKDITEYRDPGSPLSAVTDAKWLNLGGKFEEIDVTKLEGKHLTNKLEGLMATLMCSQTT